MLPAAPPSRPPLRAPSRAVAFLLLAAAGLPGAPFLLSAPASAQAPEIRAQLSPVRSTVLSSELSGKIDELPLKEGERFKEGQRIVGFDCSLHRAQLAKASAQQTEARKILEVNRRLDKLGSISTIEVEASQARFAAAEAEAQMSRIMVERCAIAAPFPGRVVEMKVKRYQFVAEGEPLMEILDDRELEAEMIVPSRWLSWLKAGTGFRLMVEETGREYAAEVTRIGARIDAVSQSVKLFARVSGEQGELLAGMSGRALFEAPRN